MRRRVRLLVAFGVVLTAVVLTGLANRKDHVDQCIPDASEVEAIRTMNPSLSHSQAEDIARYSCKFAIRPD